MSDLDSTITITVNVGDVVAEREAFNAMMLVQYHTHYTDLSRTYDCNSDGLAAMVVDGFGLGEPAYLAMAQIAGQPNHPTTVMVGRRSTVPTQIVKLTPVVSNSSTYKVYITKQNGVEVYGTYTSDSSATAAEITGGLKTSIDSASSGMTCTDGGTFITLTATTPGQYFAVRFTCTADVTGTTPGFTRTDTTTEVGIAADMTLIQTFNPAFYGMSVVDGQDPLTAAAVAAWANTNKKLYGLSTAEEGCLTSASDDIGTTLHTAKRHYNYLVHTRTPGEYIAECLMARQFAQNAGSSDWYNKSVVGCTPEIYTGAQTGYMDGKFVNYYRTVHGKDITWPGKLCSERFIDIQYGLDWLKARTQERIFDYQTLNEKVPGTQAGIDGYEACVRAQFDEAMTPEYNVLASDPAPVYNFPKQSARSTSDKAARLLSGCTASATLAGGIATITMTFNFGV
jgi:hypothetical protein